MSIATIKDVAVSLRRALTAEELAYAPDLLNRAERILRSRVRVPMARTDPTRGYSPYEQLIADIEAEAVARVLRLPADTIHRSETSGDYSYTVNSAYASGQLTILDHEWARLGVGAWGTVGVSYPRRGRKEIW